MRIVHLADLHLGFRQYQRLTPGGINQREADVARTFESAIDRIIELAPEVVLFAGDIFHSVRPSNPAILHAFIHFSRLMQQLPQSRVVMVAGNFNVVLASRTSWAWAEKQSAISKKQRRKRGHCFIFLFSTFDSVNCSPQHR